MSGPLVGAVLDDARSRLPAVRFVLCVIAEQQRKPGQSIRLSLAYLCRMTHYSRRHVIDALQAAEADGDLELTREEGRSNAYLVLPNDGQPVSSGALVPVHSTSPGGALHVTGPVSPGAPIPSVYNRRRSERANPSGARPARSVGGLKQAECVTCHEVREVFSYARSLRTMPLCQGCSGKVEVIP
jgi:hypothetical protein